MKNITKKERRQQQLERHYQTLEQLARFCGVTEPNGKKISVNLLKLEHEAHKACEWYCNGVDVFGVEFGEDRLDAVLEPIKEKVLKLFGGKLPGFFINQDPRGYALKIQDDIVRNYADAGVTPFINIQRDWGGYGLLAPEITGN